MSRALCMHVLRLINSKEEMDHEEMSKLRQSMPSIRKVLDYLKTNISDATTSKG